MTPRPPPLLRAAAADLRAAAWMPPFRLVLRDVPGELGSCTKGRGGRFVLTLAAGLSTAYPTASVLILAHEAAHALAWSRRGQSDHGPEFGRAYARVWRLLHPDARGNTP